jgi:hypothetical protein
MSSERCTFRDLFMGYLYDAIGEGGDVGTVIGLVNAYQESDLPGRRWMFRDWLEMAPFICERCGHEFKADDEVIENNQILCARCVALERGYDEARGRGRR